MPKRRVWIAHQALWDMSLLSIPLAPGYLKAYAMADADVCAEMDIRIFNFRGGINGPGLASALFRNGVPDVLAFSTFGWNFHAFGALSDAFKQLNPEGWVVFGGVHVSHQGERVFKLYPSADVVVNGEGEITFLELLRADLAGEHREPGHIQGISFRTPEGRVTTTPARDRIHDLERIPSPFLTGAIPMADGNGRFPYDVGMMETNRGCPYHCSFCYWGGAIGQKVRRFSRERLREELELFGYYKVPSVCLCDANFGMQEQDLEFVEDLIAVRARYGYPRRVDPSWAKNKSRVFYQIVRRMKEADLHATFTLALQSLDPKTLVLARRQNMKLNAWNDLADRLIQQDLECFVELIWGMPGESVQSFLEGYDRIAERIQRIATYSMILIPNTEFADNADRYKLVRVRGEADFEYALSHETMTLEENVRMHRFLFWARVLPEHLYLRHLWRPLRRLAGVRQSEILLSLDEWIDRQADDPVARGLRAYRDRVVERFDAGEISGGLRYLYGEPGVGALFERWWRECIVPRASPDHRGFFEELLRYDLATRPVLSGDHRVRVLEDDYYVREGLEFDYDVPAILRELDCNGRADPAPKRLDLTLYFKVGFGDVIDTHELVLEYVGKTRDQLLEEDERRRKAPASTGGGGAGGLHPLDRSVRARDEVPPVR
jgi:radical SAM superfamily enzyme YgiQ (UPF0313 family)